MIKNFELKKKKHLNFKILIWIENKWHLKVLQNLISIIIGVIYIDIYTPAIYFKCWGQRRMYWLHNDGFFLSSTFWVMEIVWSLRIIHREIGNWPKMVFYLKFWLFWILWSKNENNAIIKYALNDSKFSLNVRMGKITYNNEFKIDLENFLTIHRT